MDNQFLTAQHDARVNAAAASGLDTTAGLDTAAQAKAQRQERTAATKARKARCIGHATTGASAQAFPVAPGREALPVPPEKLREVIYRLTPVTSAVQVHSLQKLLRTPPETALKSGTRDERLMLAMVLDVLRSRPRFSSGSWGLITSSTSPLKSTSRSTKPCWRKLGLHGPIR